MKNLTIIFALLLLPLALFSQKKNPKAKTYTYPELVKRVYDLEYLATPPLEGEKSGTFTSYDRSSRYDAATGQYVNWEANSDGEGFIREENGGQVVFESNGPGVIWRIWSALAKEGKIKIYLDHSDTPVIDRPFRALFENFDDGVPPMNLPSFVMTLSRGRNRFLPIPYNKHCKIVLEKNWGAYYHITYSTMPVGTKLPQFTGVYSKEDGFALAEADRFLYNRGFARKRYDGEKEEKVTKTAKANAATLVKTISGNRAINHFNISLDESYSSDSAKRQDLLKNLWMRITWDKDAQPSVMVPIGLFFGAVPEVQPYRSYPIGTPDGKLFYSNWYMPFSEKATIELVNRGGKTHTVQWSIVHSPVQKPAKELLRFHAKWNNGRGFEAIQAQGRKIDWPLLITKGEGRYCGMTLHVLNTWQDPKEEASTWWYGQWDKKTIDWWWGEGDEKFFVDGEKFPSSFGTGSEDYIGYAWSAEPPFALFDSPFSAQPQTPINGNGHTIVSRFQIADNVPFFNSFEGVLEKYKENRWGEQKQNICEYESVSYWYLEPGQADSY
ncbi:glycoside hydrolase family 172 protein [Rufibacter sp. XAAS-G3-1]|uniref:glycoside hydrolase family 172 protein n=1 Tax=Rufibacter sp. XAAS-G3-1 TaxID=2729134 RepID=UPI0015E62CBF|nr:glycoside hydrolase family 172 protein [Rufibacter sp. XAAS-G3-1]